MKILSPLVALCPVLLSATALAAPTARPVHVFMEAAGSGNGRYVVSVEGDVSPSGGAPIKRDLVIRSTDGKVTAVVDLPCGRVAQCWPASPAWTRDSLKISFALRTPGSHARSIYQVNADGTHLTQLAAFDGTITDLRYSATGELAMLAVAGATKELSAVEAASPLTGDLDGPPPEQRIAILQQGKLHFASPADLFVYEYDWQHDGEGFVGTAAPGDGDNNWWVAKLYAFDAANGAARVLYAPATAQQQLAAPSVSRDGKRVAFIAGIMSDFGSTGGDLYTLPLRAGSSAVNITPRLAASVSDIQWNCNGHLIATAYAQDQTQFIDFGSGEAPSAGKVLWQGQEAIGSDSRQLAADCPAGLSTFVHQTFNRASEIRIGAIGKWHDLTHVNEGLAAPFKAQSLSWKSDEFTVQGWLVLPEAPAAAKLPLITLVHGGPASLHEPNFIGPGSMRELLEHGYAVFLPNPRGSYGQGEAFTAANVRDFGYGDLRDILAGLDMAAQKAPIDTERLGIMGHSYGGYVTMWAVTQTNRFKAAVAGAGIINWQSYYGENGIDEWMIPYFGASVYEDPAVYAKSSPITFIRKVRTPTFSYVGAADIECPAAQTLEFGHALKALGVPSVTVIYPDEGHAIHDPAHLADRSTRTLGWFDRYLKQ